MYFPMLQSSIFTVRAMTRLTLRRGNSSDSPLYFKFVIYSSVLAVNRLFTESGVRTYSIAENCCQWAITVRWWQVQQWQRVDSWCTQSTAQRDCSCLQWHQNATIHHRYIATCKQYDLHRSVPLCYEKLRPISLYSYGKRVCDHWILGYESFKVIENGTTW